jgi:hypothetical protein
MLRSAYVSFSDFPWAVVEVMSKEVVRPFGK